MIYLPRHRVAAPPRRPPGGKDTGNLFIDFLIGAAVLGVILAGVARLSIREMQRAELNAVAIELSGWLESIQRASMRLPATGSNEEIAGCVVTFTTSPGGVAPGAVIARVAPTNPLEDSRSCHPGIEEGQFDAFVMPRTRQQGANGFSKAMVTTALFGAPNRTITFTPRGTVTNTVNVDLVIRHTGANSPARCVRINGISGLIELGHDNEGNAQRCPEESFNDLI